MVWYGIIGRLFKDTLDSRGTTYSSIQYSRCPSPPPHIILSGPFPFLPILHTIYTKRPHQITFRFTDLKNIKLRPHQINLLFYWFALYRHITVASVYWLRKWIHSFTKSVFLYFIHLKLNTDFSNIIFF